MKKFIMISRYWKQFVSSRRARRYFVKRSLKAVLNG